jgi:hypothetical protein
VAHTPGAALPWVALGLLFVGVIDGGGNSGGLLLILVRLSIGAAYTVSGHRCQLPTPRWPSHPLAHPRWWPAFLFSFSEAPRIVAA